MTTTSITPLAHRPARLSASTIAMAAISVALVALCGERIWLMLSEPLWFDEAWTAQVAATPDWGAFWREVYNDLQAPLFYVSIRLWAMLAGTSDFALRAPALLALIFAGAIPAVSRIKGLGREGGVVWGLLIFAWWGVGSFLTARGYALLLLVSTLQCVAFIRLLDTPSRTSAFRWCGLACCAILLHYLAGLAVAAQGLVYLLSQRRRALRTWPALIAFAPALGWIAYHAPRLAAFNGMAAWHPMVDGLSAVAFFAKVINPVAPWVTAAVALLVVASLWTSKASAERDPDRASAQNLWLTAGAAALGFALMLALGAVRPMLIARYLIPVVPGILLGLVLCLRRSAYPQLMAFALVALYLGAALWPSNLINRLRQAAPYGYETGSAFLMQHGVKQVVFVWDHPGARFMQSASLKRVGEVFFERAGYPVEVTPLAPLETQDANPLAFAAANGDHPAVIWLYDRDSRTSARRFPPRLHEIDPRWTCQRAGDATTGALACYRAP